MPQVPPPLLTKYSPVVGTIAGPVVFAEMQNEINDYEARIEALNKLIKDEHASVLLHKTLQANVTSMKVSPPLQLASWKEFQSN